MDRTLRLGTRGSPLALAQAHQAAAAICAVHGWEASAIVIVPVVTTGDVIQDRPLAEIGGKALWTKELDRALAGGAVDCCVHSMKDVESERPDSFRIAALLPRADVRDRLIGAHSIQSLRPGAVVGTSSPRRAAQLLRLRPDLQIEPFRGNVQTRIGKVEAGEVDATLLAAAGLDRLGLVVGAAIPVSIILPASGQAAIGIECRGEDKALVALLGAASHQPSHESVSAERAFTRTLGGTCASPIAALAQIERGELILRCAIYSADGLECVADEARITPGDDHIPEELARSMLARAPQSIARLFVES
ncbi:MAG: hydroxymethylbilane synthase [Sphingomicrobium sp.]